MKKILSLLGSILLGGTSVSSVIACQPDTTNTPDEEVAKTNWSDEEILTRFGELEVTAETNGDLSLVSKNDTFKIWSGTDDGNKYERTVSKENIDNVAINYFFDSLLPTTVSYDNPYGVELMSAFFVGKTEDAVQNAIYSSLHSDIEQYIAEMTYGNQLKFRDKNAYSIYMGPWWNNAEEFSATSPWNKIIPVTASDGTEYFIGLSSIYVDFFIGYLTNNMTLWVEEFFKKYSDQITGWSDNILIDEKVNERDSILGSTLNHHKNLIIKNTTIDLTEKITLENGETTAIYIGLDSFFGSKLYTHRLKYAEMPDSKFYRYICQTTFEKNVIGTESHAESGFKVFLPNHSSIPSYSWLYMNIDVVYAE